MHILLLFSSVFLYPANTPSNPTLPEAEDEGSERSDGKYELFDQVDKQIKEGIKSLIDNCRLIFTTCLFSTNYYTTVNKLKILLLKGMNGQLYPDSLVAGALAMALCCILLLQNSCSIY